MMLYVYMFVTTIVLVNLLIAQMGERYSNILAEADQVWKTERVSLIKEYKDDRDPLPPPLNILLIPYDVFHIFTCGRRLKSTRGFKLRLNRSVASYCYGLQDEMRARYLAKQQARQQETID